MEKFIGGLALGAVMGALLVANSNKTRQLVKKGQDNLPLIYQITRLMFR